MAVEDKYVITNYANGELLDPHTSGGSKLVPFVVTFEVAAADDNNSVYRLFKMNSSDVIFQLQVSNDAITNGTDYDVGLYQNGVGGAVVDKDIFADGLDLSSAGDKANALTAPPIENLGKEVWEVAGVTSDPNVEYDVAITANTVGTASGTVTVHGLIAKRG